MQSILGPPPTEPREKDAAGETHHRRHDDLSTPGLGDLYAIAYCSLPGEWEGQVIFLPL